MINQTAIKICIHSGKGLIVDGAGLPVTFDGAAIWTAKDMLILSNSYPQQDFEGIFLPCAKNNPELPKIIRIIYNHKENLHNVRYEQFGLSTKPIHDIFHAVILKHFPDIFW